MKNLYKNDQSGRSMVEMLGVLAIIGILSVGGIAGYSKAMAKFKVSKTLDQISMLVTNIRTLYGNQNNFDGLTTANVIAYGLVTDDMKNGANAMINPFGGTIVVDTEGANKTEFTVAYAAVDKSACITIATADWGGSSSSGLVSLKIQNTTFKWGDATNPLPVTVSKAATACASATDNTVTWTYR